MRESIRGRGKGKTPTVGDSDFGMTWMEGVSCWRLVLGNERSAEDPFIQEYFSANEHGTKTAAKTAAEKRRDTLMRSRAFTNYYRYKVNGRRVKRPRKTASIGITGIVFSKGLRYRKGVTHIYPALRVYAGGELISSHPLKSLSSEIAFHAAVKSRFAKEGRAYIKKEIDKLFHAWLSKKEVKSFLLKNNIPIYSDEQIPIRG